MTNLEKYKDELKDLITTGNLMEKDLDFRALSEDEKSKLSNESKEVFKKVDGLFESKYQEWYTESIAILRQLIPDRLNEFISLYQIDPKRKEISSITYSIQDWLNGVRAGHNNFSGKKYFDDFASIIMKFKTQNKILKSAQKRFESSLFDIKQIIQADLFDSEIDVSKELNGKGFYRAAGIICGVILEKHLRQVCDNHKITIRKKNPTISDLNDLLKHNNNIEVATWRFIQHLGDLRNKCGHNKTQDPTKEEVDDLISGTEKIIKTIY
ncbi:MAG: hypothetical protein ACOC1K_03525 [Nanoarchaeota archaeon]